MIARQIVCFGQPAVVICDAKCGKAWGIHSRPRITFGFDPDDYAFLADDEVGEAPADPGTYEGGHAKPASPDERLNKWCVRACERCTMSSSGGAGQVIEATDFSRRLFNQPWKHPALLAQAEAPSTSAGGKDA